MPEAIFKEAALVVNKRGGAGWPPVRKVYEPNIYNPLVLGARKLPVSLAAFYPTTEFFQERVYRKPVLSLYCALPNNYRFPALFPV